VRTPRIGLSPSNRHTRTLSAVVALAVASAAAAAQAEEAQLDGASPGSPPVPSRGALATTQQRPLRLTLSMIGYTDTSGVYSAEPRLIASVPTVLGAELRLGGSYTADGLQLAAAPRGPGGPPAAGRGSGSTTTAPGRSMAGGALSIPWSVFRASVGYAVYFDSQTTLHDREIGLTVKPCSGLELSGALRHRPFVEMAEPLAVDEQVFYTAGPGGAMNLLAAWPLAVDELRLIGKVAPTAWSYVYGDARRMAISDGNRGWNASVGAGASVAQLLGFRGPVDVTARWDTWAAAYSATSAVYYSPANIVTHSPGLEVRLRRSAFEIAAEGGITFAPGQNFTGSFWGGSAVLHLGRVSIVARGQTRSDPWFASRKVWLAVQSDL
jgi:hypothetical protein